MKKLRIKLGFGKEQESTKEENSAQNHEQC